MVVLPTHVGMSRTHSVIPFLLLRAPHTRGDEPPHVPVLSSITIVLPTHVGMSRVRTLKP